jgi:hypothetical protein
VTARRTPACKRVDSEFDRAFRGSGALSEQAWRHLAECEHCRELYDWLVRAPARLDPSPEVCRRIRQALAAALAPVQPLPPARVTVARLMAMFVAFALGALLVMGAGGVDRMTQVQIFAMSGVLAGGVALLSLSLAWQMRPGSRHRIRPEVAVVALGVGVLLGMALLFPWRWPQAYVRQGWMCGVTGSAAAAAPGALLFWLLIRRGMPLSLPKLGATLGAMAGLLAVAVLQFECSQQEAWHLLGWHGGVLVVATAVGALAGWVAARRRSRRNRLAAAGE